MRDTGLLPLQFYKDDYQLRAEEIQRAGKFGEVYQEDGETHSYAALAPVACEAQEQLTLDLGGYSDRAMIRRLLSEKIGRLSPRVHEEYIQRYPARLAAARHHGQVGIRLNTGKPVVFWDEKAGLARLCPDDAREDAMRLRRKYKPTYDQLREQGYRFLYCVFTLPNYERGKLRQGMADIFDRFKRLQASDCCPHLKGSLAVLEAPLGRSRDWNVHLNVIFAVKGGFVDFGRIRKQWHWNVEMRWIADGPGAFEGAMAELIKYAVAATVAKSAQKFDDGESHAPPMLEWTEDRDGELHEWLTAFHDFRRVRSYGELYGVKAPEPEDMGPIAWVGTTNLSGGRYVLRFPLLDSIPEDKSGGGGGPRTYVDLLKSLALGGIKGAGTLGHSIPRDVLHSSSEN
jgi:hypothetical protein